MKMIFAVLALVFSAHAYAVDYLDCRQVTCHDLGCIPSQIRGVTINPDIGYFSTDYDDGGGFELTQDQIYVQGTSTTFDRHKECQEKKYSGKRGITYSFTCLQATNKLDLIFSYDPAHHSGTYEGSFNIQKVEYIFKKCAPSV